MHTDPTIPLFVSAILFILILGVIMKRFKQPHVIAYLITGIILGPHVLGVISDPALITRLGAFGVIFLLFFIGMEISPQRLIENWFISIIGTLLQILISVGIVFLISLYLQWSLAKAILLGFVISLSSTAVILKLLEDWKEMNTRVGQDVLGILLVQDLIIIPMLIILGFLGGQRPSLHTLALQCMGGVFVIALTVWLLIKEEIKLPWLKLLGTDHEMQVFAALGICFGMALITGLTELSAALGAFVGGMIVASAKETHWVHHSLSSIKVIFIALFFVSIGMLIDPHFIHQHALQIALLVFTAFLFNLAINAGILRALGETWGVSLYGGSLLSQIGEFSFILAAMGYQIHVINESGYKMTVSIIALSLLLSPLWIVFIKQITNVANTRLKKIN